MTAIFDLDLTLIDYHSGKAWLDQECAAGRTSLARVALALALNETREAALMEVARSAYGGMRAEKLAGIGRAFVRDAVLPRLRPLAMATVARHRSSGETVALASATLSYVAAPTCMALNMEQAASTVLGVADGACTGRVDRLAYAYGKLVQVEAWAERAGVRLGDCVFYSDSISDVPLLEAVGHPVCVNPDPALRAAAQERSWEVQHWG